jgi:hypothetical protein
MLKPKAAGLVGCDVYDSVLTPGDVILMMVWKSKGDADSFAKSATLPPGGRLRHVRVVRDYSMFDRREAPQYYGCESGIARLAWRAGGVRLHSE